MARKRANFTEAEVGGGGRGGGAESSALSEQIFTAVRKAKGQPESSFGAATT